MQAHFALGASILSLARGSRSPAEVTGTARDGVGGRKGTLDFLSAYFIYYKLKNSAFKNNIAFLLAF